MLKPQLVGKLFVFRAVKLGPVVRIHHIRNAIPQEKLLHLVYDRVCRGVGQIINFPVPAYNVLYSLLQSQNYMCFLARSSSGD